MPKRKNKQSEKKEESSESSSSLSDNEISEDLINPKCRPKVNKAEKRARKLFAKVDLEPVPDINKVVIRRTTKMSFAVVNAQCFKVKGTNSYVVFGDAKTNDMTNPMNINPGELDIESEEANNEDPIKEEAKIEEIDEDVEETDQGVSNKMESADKKESAIDASSAVQPKDVQLVMSQTGASEERVIKTLLKNKNDLVSTIMELSG